MSRLATALFPWAAMGLTSGIPALRSDAAVVNGTIHHASNPQAPVSGARVTLFTPSLSQFWETRTDAQGAYDFSAVPIGSYQLGACALGLEYLESTVVVPAAGLQQNLLLGPETEAGEWQIIGDTLPELFDATDIGILRPDGKVFFCHDTVDPILFDPVTGQKSFPAGSPSEQGCMSGSVLEDGGIIMVGGQNGSSPGSFMNAIPWVKKYSPDTDSWQYLPPLQLPQGRWYPGLARLADGSFLAMGGGTAPSAVRTDTCERFDLASQTWSFTGTMLNPCEFPPTALLFNGQVLATWSPPQLYDPAAGTWQATGNFNQPNRGFPNHADHSLVMLADGRALAIGIRQISNPNPVMGEIYDPAPGTWSYTSNPGLTRMQPEVVQLPDGRILVAAGQTQVDPIPVPHVLGVVKWTDLFDPTLNTWRRVADLNWFREYHAVTLLVADGRVVTTGGTQIQFQYGPTSADIEGFVPPYLLRGVRPQITSIATATPTRGASVTLEIAPQTQLTSVVLIGTAAPTHWVDGGLPRRLVLPLTQSGSTITTYLPIDPNTLPLGHYMLFAMVDDIPSVAKIIRVRPPTLGDVDGDDDIDLNDYGVFPACLSGPAALPPAGCALVDLNTDGDVDLRDLAGFQTVFGEN